MSQDRAANLETALLPDRSSPLGVALRSIRRFFARKPVAGASAIIVVAMIVVAAAAPLIAPYDYDKIDLTSRLQGPSWDHPFGTDNTGRDIFSRVVYGARVSVAIGFGATLIGTVVATLIGLTSGYLGRTFDTIVQRIIEVWQAFPGLIFIVFVVSIAGSSITSVVVTIGLLFAAGSSRVVRGAVLGITSESYVEAAKVLGASDLRIMLRHVLPNILPVVIVIASIQIGGVILVESSLAFLGFGVPPPFPSWGRMLQDGQRFMQAFPHLALFPGAAIALVVFSFNMLGDGLRDVLDPRLRSQ